MANPDGLGPMVEGSATLALGEPPVGEDTAVVPLSWWWPVWGEARPSPDRVDADWWIIGTDGRVVVS